VKLTTYSYLVPTCAVISAPLVCFQVLLMKWQLCTCLNFSVSCIFWVQRRVSENVANRITRTIAVCNFADEGLGDLDVDGTVILKWIVNTYDTRVWTLLILLRVASSVELM
jgi:hypothetical protein